ncbi:hypothetical protein FHS61_002495 [Altererythrobacter atlanticus]|uniref:Uncharacterized protein n=1 Tax=Croceibacterium atlanticum TaxID=1267766 RepID=A0A0F7KRW4_9SPHN|nr:hypothetical protein [Croceibacterium atlanticum]AKH41972.1 hypothetical protein WYH_00924 [Croceibacterium atlanticum]MBB5733460.1 hypothetical protein [Croceibacterium atlanticum]
MSKDRISTDRRAFLKTGALIATPIAAVTPVAALADDGTRARLARMEDERAIGQIHRAALRSLNASGDCGRFAACADAIRIDPHMRAITEDQAAEPELTIAEDGLKARYRSTCQVEVETEFTGHSTLERMARFQGQGFHRHVERKRLEADYVKKAEGWQIASLRLA